MSGLRSSTAIVLLSSLAAAACSGGGGDATSDEVVNVYSHRHYEADQELFRSFTEMTGIRVNVQTASADELITRLEAEGESTIVDLLITVDAGRLHRAKERGLLQPVSTPTLDANVPSHLREPDGFWYGLTQRGRVIVYATDRVDPSELSSYEDLADPRWKGRVLVRSSENIYNQSLLASIISSSGEEAAQRWAEGIVANMARAPQGGDTDQIKDVAAGVGDVAIVNTYYLGRLLNSDEAADREVADKVGVFFPNQADRGTHVNVSGAGVTAYSPNRDNAIRLLEFLTDVKAQSVFAEANLEYPVNPGVEWAATLAGWGEFVADTLNLATLGELNARAVMVFDRAGWR
ncbi:MAG: Fe(3+) ABC transporter substrate-binding protein [Longimicrobiales bacterium]